jgi:centrosomal protein CEP104
MELAESELSLVAVALVRPVRSQSAWRIVLGRLSIMLDLVPRFGLAKAGDHGLTLEAVMEFTARTFESPNGEVRSTAVKLTLECCAIAGRAVEKFLPKNLKPAIRDVIDEGLGIKTGMDRGRDDDGTVTAANARGGGRAQGGVEPRRAPATPPGARGGGPGGSGYGGSLNAPPGAPPTARELKAEIAERELELGKNHPDVAVALTDLAALYSEEENFAEARPLYERALRIQEKTLGAEHQDTTQTLTDLAICHLDQGNNDVGRPLLERALVLQERALGPDHADVTAIRDVLQSLDAEDA